MVGRSLAQDLKPRGISVHLLHPGMVATEMTGGKGIPVSESAANLIERMGELGQGHSGTFYHAAGDPLPW